MHCNLRHPDEAPVHTRFNYYARAKFEVAQPFHRGLSVFTAHTLHYAVIFNFDPVTLTFTFDLEPF